MIEHFVPQDGVSDSGRALGKSGLTVTHIFGQFLDDL